MTAKALLRGFSFTLQYGTAPLPVRLSITDVVTDAETATPSSCFVCTQTVLKNGHYDAPVAYQNGCRLFVAERGLSLPSDATVLIAENTKDFLGPLAAKCYRFPATHLRAVGITGTYGKSAVVLQCAAALSRLGKRVGVISTDGVEYDGNYFPAGPVAPDAADIQRTLFKFCQHGVDVAFIELSAYQLANGAAEGLALDTTLLTNLSPHHIGRGLHRSFEDYRAAKQRLLQAKSRHQILPIGEKELATHRHPITFGQESGDYTAKDAALLMGKDGAPAFSFTLSNFAKRCHILSPVPTLYGVENTLASAALLCALGIPLAKAAAALSASCPRYRTECIYHEEGRWIFLDTAYTGEDAERVLRALRPLAQNRLSVVLGSVGGRARERRAPLGAAALSLADFCFFTEDDADMESPTDIIRDMLRDAPDTALHYEIIPDRQKAIATAVRELRRGDVLLILGKAAPYQWRQGQKHPFSDKETALSYLP